MADIEEEPWVLLADNEESIPDDEDPYYKIRARQDTKGDIFYACRVGDVARVRHLIEHDDVDVNRRDAWDSVCLYYACLAGHLHVVRCLLEAGAVCNEHTFDGDRCHYASLTLQIRHVLRQYEARPPPLSPLAASLRGLSPLVMADGDASSTEAVAGQPPVADRAMPYADFEFVVDDEVIPLHRAVLAARSPYFDHMLRGRWQTAVAGDACCSCDMGSSRGNGSRAASTISSCTLRRCRGPSPKSTSRGQHLVASSVSGSHTNGAAEPAAAPAAAAQGLDTSIGSTGGVTASGCSAAGAGGSSGAAAMRRVVLHHPALSPVALRALLVYLYTERVDVPMHEVDALRLIANKCRLPALVSMIDRELASIRRDYKSTSMEVQPQRLVLQPWAFAEGVRLAADLRRLRQRCVAAEALLCRAVPPAMGRAPPHSAADSSMTWGLQRVQGPGAGPRSAAAAATTTPHSVGGLRALKDDFADVALRAEGHVFRCHRCVLTARSEFFKTLFERSKAFQEGEQEQPLQASRSGQRGSGSGTRSGSRTHGDNLNSWTGSGVSGPATAGTVPPVSLVPTVPVYDLGEISAETLNLALEWIYTDALLKLPPRYCTAHGLEELLHAAELLLIFPLKRAAADAAITQLRGSGKGGGREAPGGADGPGGGSDADSGAGEPSLDLVCRLLLIADLYAVRVLREFCLGHVAARFDQLVDAACQAPQWGEQREASRHNGVRASLRRDSSGSSSSGGGGVAGCPPGGAMAAADTAVFAEFVRCLLAEATAEELQDAELLLDGSHLPGASKGNIEGGGLGGLGQGTILQDLREMYLERASGAAAGRDILAAAFDARLLTFAAHVLREGVGDYALSKP